MKRFFAVSGLVLALGLGACSTPPTMKPIEDSGYYEVTHTAFDRFIVADPEAFTPYEKIIFSALNFDHFELLPVRDERIARSWQDLTTEDKLVFARYFKSELMQVYAGDRASATFGLGSGRDPNTLYAEVRLKSLKPYTGKFGEDTSGTITDNKIESFGWFTVEIVLIDSTTEAFVALVEDGRDLAVGNSVKIRANRTSSARVWKRQFENLLIDLRQSLLELKGPPPS